MPRLSRLSPPNATNHSPRHSLQRGLTALLCATCLSAVAAPLVRAQSALLESVKQNPALAQSLCQQFRQLNAQGISATSKASISSLASSRSLSPMDAEVLATYVIGLHCSTVF
jgi:hypothetical protein